MTMPRAEDGRMLTYIGQRRLYISATEQKQYLHRAQGTFAENHLPWSIWQVVKNIAKSSAKAIPLPTVRNVLLSYLY
jgi:hypothetical protein